MSDDKDFEKWYEKYEHSGASIIGVKRSDSEECVVKYIGKGIELLYVFEEVVRELSKVIDKELLDVTYNVAFGEGEKYE